MELSTSVLMVIFIFTFIPLVLAEVARANSIPTVGDFFLQSRSMPTVMVFFTVYATWVSSFAFMGSASSFYSQGPLYMTAFAWNGLFGLLFMTLGKRLWFYGKCFHYITPTDFFHDIYGSKQLDGIVTGILIVFTIPYLMIQLSGGAYLIETATYGLIPWRVAGLIFYLIIIIYLWAGGLRAVALADIFYGCLIFLSMLITGFFVVWKAGGIQATFQIMTETNPELLTLPQNSPWSSSLLWLGMFLIVPVGALMGPQMWIRIYATGRLKTFQIMPLLIILATIMYLGPLFAGSAGRALLPNLTHTDNLIPQLLAQYAPPILGAILLCGIAAAALSTANSQIHALATIYTMDVHRRYINPNAPERTLVSVGKWSVLGISAVAYILLLQSPGLIIETGTIGMSGTAQLIVPTLGALFWKRSHAAAASWGLIVGVFFLILLLFATDLPVIFAAILALTANILTFIPLSAAMPTVMSTRKRIVEYQILYENR
jgi:SSS family solute:Na+ symporter